MPKAIPGTLTNKRIGGLYMQPVTIYSAEQVKLAWNHINEKLVAGFSGWSPTEWLERHTAVSDEDFLQEPHRNRLTVVLSRNTHMAFHFGQAILTKPREKRS